MLKSAIGSIRFTVVSAVLAVAPISVTAETLRDALVGAYNHSGLLEQNRALLRAADEDVAQSVAALRPIINYTASVTRSIQDSRSSFSPTGAVLGSATTDISAGINLSILVWNNGISKLGVEAAKETVLSARQGLISLEQQVLFQAAAAFFNVGREEENVNLLRSNLRLIRQELRAAEDRFEVGEVTRTDVAQAQARLAEARGDLAAAMGGLVSAQEAYAAVVGRKPGNLTQPRRLPKFESNVAQAKKVALRRHPDILQAQHAISAADIVVQQAKRNTSPTVNLTGNVNSSNSVGDSSFSETTTFGLQASGPIYQGGALASQTRAAIANRDSQRGNLRAVADVVGQNVGNAYAQFRVSQAQLEETAIQIQAAQIAYDGVREEATLGARTTLDVLDAEQALLNAQASRISAQADRSIAAYQVLTSLGLMTATNLDLGIQQYDPNAYYNLVKDSPRAKSDRGRKLDKVLRSLQRN